MPVNGKVAIGMRLIRSENLLYRHRPNRRCVGFLHISSALLLMSPNGNTPSCPLANLAIHMASHWSYIRHRHRLLLRSKDFRSRLGISTATACLALCAHNDSCCLD